MPTRCDTEQLKRNWNNIQKKIEDGTIVAGWAVGFGGVAEALCKMSFGNAFGFDVNLPEDELFNLSYGSIVVETDGSALDFENAIEIGTVTSGEDGNVRVNGTKLSIFEMMDFNASLFEKVYPAVSKPDFKRLLPKGMEGVKPFKAKKADLEYMCRRSIRLSPTFRCSRVQTATTIRRKLSARLEPRSALPCSATFRTRMCSSQSPR